MTRWSCVAVALWLAFSAFVAPAAEPDAAARVRQVVDAAGGPDKLLTLFRLRERINVSSDLSQPGKERVSVLEPPDHWWLGKRDRVTEDKEPATFLVWAWTLGALTAPESKIETVPDVTEENRPAFGLRVSGSIDPPMELYFDRESSRLVRIDWRSDIHRFSDWRTVDGTGYPAKVIGYKKASGKPWYTTEVLEVERLDELPAGLAR